MSKEETEQKLKALEKSQEELQGVLRRNAQETNSILSTLSKLSEDVSVVKAELALLKKEKQDQDKKDLKVGRTNY